MGILSAATGHPATGWGAAADNPDADQAVTGQQPDADRSATRRGPRRGFRCRCGSSLAVVLGRLGIERGDEQVGVDVDRRGAAIGDRDRLGGVRGGVDRLELAHGYLGVDLDGGQLGMAEHGLDEPDVGAVLQHQRRHRVAEQVARAALAGVGRVDVLAHHLGHAPRCERLTDAIRAALVRDGTLGDDALVATVLEPCGFTRAEAQRAASYQPGQVVTFRKGGRGKPRPGIGYRVDQVDDDAGSVRLIGPKDKAIGWRPARWGADVAEAFTEVEQEFRAGDKLQFTRNNYRAKRLNGQVATVVAVDPRGSSLWVEQDDGARQMLDMTHLADRHIRPGWVRTIHSAQGATAERVIAHLEAFRANIVDAGAAYVAISRARSHAAIYTDSRASLTDALGIRDGAQIGAIDETMRQSSLSYDTFFSA